MAKYGFPFGKNVAWSVYMPKYGFPFGKNVAVRTVTMIYTGVLEEINEGFLVLTKCSWVPETERYSDFVKTGAVAENEPFNPTTPVFVNMESIAEFSEMGGELETSQK